MDWMVEIPIPVLYIEQCICIQTTIINVLNKLHFIEDYFCLLGPIIIFLAIQTSKSGKYVMLPCHVSIWSYDSNEPE